MSFLMGWTSLLGLLGISIPIIIHLLHRQRTQPVLWGAMQFLRTSPLQMKRKKKVDHWLLMLMRMLALAVLAFLLARPMLAQSKFVPKGLTDSPIDVAVVIDHSLSTGRLSSGQTVFDRSVAMTDKMLDQLKPGDTFTVVLAEHTPRPLNQQPIKKTDSGGLNQLHQRLGQEKQGMTDCSIPEAISAARHVLSFGRNANKLILVVSDQQRSNWHIKEDALWRSALGGRTGAIARNLAIHAFPIAPDAENSNVSVGAVSVQPTILGADRPVQINATVSNTGTQPMSGLFARLVVNGKELGTQPVTALAPKTSATIRFDLDAGVAQPGSNWVKVGVNAIDALQADNEAVAPANVLPRIPVLVIDGQLSDAGSLKSSQFLQAAMQPRDNSLVQAHVMSVSDATTARLQDYMVVVVNDAPMLPQSLRDKLSSYAASGHGVWFILGPRTLKPLIEKDLAASGFMTVHVREVMNVSEAPSGVEVKDSSNPVLHVVTANERNALTGTATRKWWGVTAEDAQVVLTASNGDPLILERPYGTNGGIITVWATSVDGSWNNWNLIPNFVPLVNETIYHLSGPQLQGLENRGIEAGQPIVWAGPIKPNVQSVPVDITLPDGSRVTRPAANNNGRYMLTYADTFLPGIYQLQFGSADFPPVYYGVNIDHTELDPTILDPDDVTWLKNGGYLDAALPTITESDLPMVIRRQSQGRELWGWLGGALLASLLIETFLTYRLIGSQKRVDVAGAGLPTAHAA